MEPPVGETRVSGPLSLFNKKEDRPNKKKRLSFVGAHSVSTSRHLAHAPEWVKSIGLICGASSLQHQLVKEHIVNELH